MDEDEIIETEDIIEEDGEEELGQEQDNKDNASGKQTESETEDFNFQDDNSNPPLQPAAPQDEFIEEDKKIEIAVQKVLSPVLRQTEQQRVDSEWNQIVSQYPEAKGLEGKVKRWALTDGSIYKGQPLKSVFHEVAGEDFFLQVGAKRAARANKAADEDKGTHAGTARPQMTETNNGAGKFSLVGKKPDEIRQVLNQVRSGRFQS